MGYALCQGACWSCGKFMSFNPMRVPSIRVKGHREPVCLDCVNAANPIRIRNGLEPIVPYPDAYEPCDESELE